MIVPEKNYFKKVNALFPIQNYWPSLWEVGTVMSRLWNWPKGSWLRRETIGTSWQNERCRICVNSRESEKPRQSVSVQPLKLARGVPCRNFWRNLRLHPVEMCFRFYKV